MEMKKIDPWLLKAIEDAVGFPDKPYDLTKVKAITETATFYIDSTRECFIDFNAYKRSIMSANNILDIERNQSFWD